MIRREEINADYFEWMIDIVCRDRFAPNISYRKMLTQLHAIEFVYSIPMDENRAVDGIELRRRYALRHGYDDLSDYLTGPCSVFEMILALAIRCEETIMDDTAYGNRTAQWFWGMIVNLGLGAVTDDQYDEQYVEDVILRFLNHEYEPDGRGGLFRVRHCNRDLRTVEIWYQMNWYLDTIT